MIKYINYKNQSNVEKILEMHVIILTLFYILFSLQVTIYEINSTKCYYILRKQELLLFVPLQVLVIKIEPNNQKYI